MIIKTITSINANGSIRIRKQLLDDQAHMEHDRMGIRVLGLNDYIRPPEEVGNTTVCIFKSGRVDIYTYEFDI